jgi:hypothetical protein
MSMIKGRERQGEQGKIREKREERIKTRKRKQGTEETEMKKPEKKQMRATVNWKPVDTR